MAGVATNATDDIGSEVALFGTIVFAVSNFAAVLTGLVLIVTQGTVKGSQLAQLIALQFILTFGNRSGLSLS